MKRRTKFLINSALVVPAVWAAVYCLAMIYHWLTGRGGSSSASGLAWGCVLVMVVVAITNWRDILNIMKSRD